MYDAIDSRDVSILLEKLQIGLSSFLSSIFYYRFMAVDNLNTFIIPPLFIKQTAFSAAFWFWLPNVLDKGLVSLQFSPARVAWQLVMFSKLKELDKAHTFTIIANCI